MIKVKQVRLNYLEGARATQEKYAGRVYGSVAAFDAALRVLSHEAPATGGYDKIDFTITFEDGETYNGRYDLKHYTIERPSLADHVLRFLRFSAGLERPAHVSAEMHRKILARDPEWSAQAGAFLQTYEVA